MIKQTRQERWWRVALVVLAVALIAASCSSDSDDQSAGAVDSELGTVSDVAFPFAGADGSETSLDALAGQPMVVNFFAAWCGPCRAEMPDIEAVHQQLGDQVAFVGVSHDFEQADWLEFVDDTGVTFDTYFQPSQEIFLELELFGMPSTIFVDESGAIVHAHTGIVTDDGLVDLIAEHLSVEA